MRFLARADSVSVRDTLRAYTIDSVALSFTVAARDTNLDRLHLLLYRLAPSFDSAHSFADVAPAFVPENLIATLSMCPTLLNTGMVRRLCSRAPISAGCRFQPADSGGWRSGSASPHPRPTGVRSGRAGGGNGPIFTTYATLDVPDTGTAKLRTLALSAAFNTYVSEVPQVAVDTTLLAVGGAPVGAGAAPLQLPSPNPDSATIVRATLELTPGHAYYRSADRSCRLLRPGRSWPMSGAKSPVSTIRGRVPEDTLETGATAVSMEAVRIGRALAGSVHWPACGSGPVAHAGGRQLLPSGVLLDTSGRPGASAAAPAQLPALLPLRDSLVRRALVVFLLAVVPAPWRHNRPVRCPRPGFPGRGLRGAGDRYWWRFRALRSGVQPEPGGAGRRSAR